MEASFRAQSDIQAMRSTARESGSELSRGAVAVSNTASGGVSAVTGNTT